MACALLVDGGQLVEAIAGEVGIEGLEPIGERSGDVLVGFLGELRGIVLEPDAPEYLCDEVMILSCEH